MGRLRLQEGQEAAPGSGLSMTSRTLCGLQSHLVSSSLHGVVYNESKELWIKFKIPFLSHIAAFQLLHSLLWNNGSLISWAV